ncbi:MAG: HAD family phosphatase [Planctomycetota bacterium]
MLEAIVFDFDGVLVDSEPLHYQAFVLIARSLGFELTFEQYVQTYIGFDDRDAFRVMLEVTGREVTDAAVAELCAKKQPAFDALAKATGELALPGSVELLDAAQAAGFKVAIASGATRADINLMLGLLDRSDAFEAIVTADDVKRSKPDPASYAQAAVAIGVEPVKCLAIEDTRAGLKSATAAGLRTLAVTTSHEADELTDDAERVIHSLAGVTVKQLQTWYA